MSKYVVITGNGFFELYTVFGVFNSEQEANNFADRRSADTTVIELNEVSN